MHRSYWKSREKKNTAHFNPWKEPSCNDNVWNHILWGGCAKIDRK